MMRRLQPCGEEVGSRQRLERLWKNIVGPGQNRANQDSQHPHTYVERQQETKIKDALS